MAEDNKNIEARITQLEQRVEELERQVKALQDNPPAAPAVEEPVAQPQPVQSEYQTIYLGPPTPEGIFEEFSDEQQAGKSIYQLSTRDGRNGTFIMLQTPEALATANISVSQFIKPVCKIMGNSRIMPRRIDTVEEGRATKDGAVWRVLRKAVVAFEN
ncbi:MAG: hypothetical protein ACOYJG_08525 [Prevotella sp.]|jgi:hypothetical protein